MIDNAAMINRAVTQRFWIRGNVGAALFTDWIARHAARLGLRGQVIAQEASCVTAIFSGPADLLDALAVGCSLGPQEIWVDEIIRSAESDGQEQSYA